MTCFDILSKGGAKGRMSRAKIFFPLLISTLVIVFPIEILLQTDKWKSQNDRGNRYEGRIQIPLGQPDLELLSFSGFREQFDADVILKVRFYLPTNSTVFIQGRELREQKQYWMESKPANWQAHAWNEFGPWATREVLTREEIPPWNLGVVVRLREETSDGGELVPAFVYHSTLPASITKYSLYLRPNSVLKKVSYSLYRISHDQEIKVKASFLSGEKIAGEPFLIELEVGHLSEGPMRLVVEGSYKNRMGGPIREYSFYHKPEIH